LTRPQLVDEPIEHLVETAFDKYWPHSPADAIAAAAAVSGHHKND